MVRQHLSPRQGERFTINKIAFRGHDDFKGQSFIGESVKLNIKVVSAKSDMGIETIIDGKPQIIGVFGTHRDQAPGKQAFFNAGLLTDGVTFDATINSRPTLGLIRINPETIKYPELGEWIKTTQLLPGEQKPSLKPQVAYFHERLSTHPTLLSINDEKWQLPNGLVKELPTFQITVDIRKAKMVEKYLTDIKVPFVFKSSIEERKRSVITLATVEGDLPPLIRNKLEIKFGSVLTNDKYQENLSEIPTFSEEVRRKFRKREELLPYIDINPLEIPLRDLPVLLSSEEYDWPSGDDYVTEPTWRITVDHLKFNTVVDWLSDNKIPHSLATDSFDLESEERLGYKLIRFIESDLSEPIKQQLINRFGTVLDANRDGNYYEAIEAIATGQTWIINKPSTNSKSPNTFSQLLESSITENLSHHLDSIISSLEETIDNCSASSGLGKLLIKAHLLTQGELEQVRLRLQKSDRQWLYSHLPDQFKQTVKQQQFSPDEAFTKAIKEYQCQLIEQLPPQWVQQTRGAFIAPFAKKLLEVQQTNHLSTANFTLTYDPPSGVLQLIDQNTTKLFAHQQPDSSFRILPTPLINGQPSLSQSELNQWLQLELKLEQISQNVDLLSKSFQVISLEKNFNFHANGKEHKSEVGLEH